MKVIYLWITDFIENKEQIEEQLSMELTDLRIKVVLVYEEEYVWKMGDK